MTQDLLCGGKEHNVCINRGDGEVKDLLSCLDFTTDVSRNFIKLNLRRRKSLHTNMVVSTDQK